MNNLDKQYINERIEALRVELESKFMRHNNGGILAAQLDNQEHSHPTKEGIDMVSKILEEPDFEVGVWYKHDTEETYGLFRKLGEDNKGFCRGEWANDVIMYRMTSWKKLTDFTELTELLKKEAVKRGMIDGAFKLFKHGSVLKIKYPLNYSLNNKQLIDDDGLILMDSNGTWAEVVKEKTTEEWITDCRNFCVKNYGRLNYLGMQEFFKQNKLEITQE